MYPGRNAKVPINLYRLIFYICLK